MTNSSLQAPVGAAISDKMNALRAIVHRNTLAAAYKNYMGRHDQAMHTTLFNLANPSSGERRVSGAGDVRAKDAGTGAGDKPLLPRGEGYGKRGESTVTFNQIDIKNLSAAQKVDLMQKLNAHTEIEVAKAYNGISYRDLDENNENYELIQSYAQGVKQDYLKVLGEVKDSGKQKGEFRDVYEKRVTKAAADKEALASSLRSADPSIRADAAIKSAAIDDRMRVVDGLYTKFRIRELKEESVAARVALTAEKYALVKLQRGIDFGKRLDLKGVDRADVGEGGSTGFTNLPYTRGAQSSMLPPQQAKIAAAQQRFDTAGATLKSQTKAFERAEKQSNPMGGAGGKVLPRTRADSPEGNIKGVLAMRPMIVSDLVARTQSELKRSEEKTGKANHYFTQFDRILIAARAGSPEALGTNFLKVWSRDIGGTIRPGNYADSPKTVAQSKYPKSAQDTQAKMDRLHRMLVTAQKETVNGVADADRTVTRATVSDFLKTEMGLTDKDMVNFKELSDFQFTFKMLREINRALGAIATYKSRQHNKHVGDVVKQNMARYFQF